MSWMTRLAVGVLLMLLPAVGFAGDGVVALQSADPSCPDSTNAIYVNCGNGTITDNRTGLVWLANANCLGTMNWYSALKFVAGLSDLPGADVSDCGLSDESSPGEWRLPSADEWEVMVAFANALDCDPAITNDQGDDCWGSGVSSFSDVKTGFYWSSTTDPAATTTAWSALLLGGDVGGGIPKTATPYVWPVRGGQ